MADVLSRAILYGHSSSAERRNRSDILRAGACAALLASTIDQWFREMQRVVTLDQRTRALGAAELVGAQRQQVGPERFDVERNAPRGLDRINVQQAALAMHDLGRGRDRLHCPGLVVGRHEGDKRPSALFELSCKRSE